MTHRSWVSARGPEPLGQRSLHTYVYGTLARSTHYWQAARRTCGKRLSPDMRSTTHRRSARTAFWRPASVTRSASQRDGRSPPLTALGARQNTHHVRASSNRFIYTEVGKPCFKQPLSPPPNGLARSPSIEEPSYQPFCSFFPHTH